MRKILVFIITVVLFLTLTACKEKEELVQPICMGDEEIVENICEKLEDTYTSPEELSILLNVLVDEYELENNEDDYEFIQYHWGDIIDRNDFDLSSKVEYSLESELKGLEYYVNWTSTWFLIDFSKTFITEYSECVGLTENIFCEYNEGYSFRYNVVGKKIVIEIFDLSESREKYAKLILNYKGDTKSVSFFHSAKIEQSESVTESYYEEGLEFWEIRYGIQNGNEDNISRFYFMEHILLEDNMSYRFSTSEHGGNTSGYLFEVTDYNKNFHYSTSETGSKEGNYRILIFDEQSEIFEYTKNQESIILKYNMLYMSGWDQISLEGYEAEFLNEGEIVEFDSRQILNYYRSDYAPMISIEYDTELTNEKVNGEALGLEFTGVTYEEVMDIVNIIEAEEYKDIIINYGLSSDLEACLENFGGNITEQLYEMEINNPFS